jgi:queuine tRNA-ribosyltransferase
MRPGFSFRVLAGQDAARRGELSTPHGSSPTPAFMPVGTCAAVKGLSPAQLQEAGVQIVLANTYHLLLRPGPEVVAALGGLHRFMGWAGPILTDSGGYQVFSLADLRALDDEGVSFRSHVDGLLVRLTPERAIEVQNQLGADVIMVLDECPPLPADARMLRKAVERSVAWAGRCKRAHRREDQALFGIVQGGLDRALRRECLTRLREIGFDGYALGGLSVGEPPEDMAALLRDLAPDLPVDAPRYLMGVGRPVDLVHAVASGIDLFDCVLPTRNGRKGYAFTSRGVVRLRNARHRTSSEPLDPACRCYVCRTFARGYLRHLLVVGEALGGTLTALHNVAFYQGLMAAMREALEAGRFAVWRDEFLRSPPVVAGEDES